MVFDGVNYYGDGEGMDGRWGRLNGWKR